MNQIVATTSTMELFAPRCGEISIRVATMSDLPFLDSLQKQHSKALGFFPRAQMQGYVSNGWVLIAEDAATKQPVGYCASRDRYLKRDELGVIYQLCVADGAQRKLIGASLIKAAFDRAAYGCRLFCCWCAQDLAANYFWESLGFVPIAFRAGSAGKKRVHIFWQKRTVEGDATPWWYPFKTDQGAMREDRIVFPIPPRVHWKGRSCSPAMTARRSRCSATQTTTTQAPPRRSGPRESARQRTRSRPR
ncbi:MAG TPA: GNAT family N-acetyltransferase [Tepidisphaeraceae bacterium]|nr:GNAT family N-acetyltransferase [Tepidisphaeraceae bacterium]